MDDLPEIQPQLKRQRAAAKKKPKKDEMPAKSMDVEIVKSPEEEDAKIDAPVPKPFDISDIVEKIQSTIDSRLLNEREFHIEVFKRSEAGHRANLQAVLDSINDTHVIMKKGFKTQQNVHPMLLQTPPPDNEFIWNTKRSLYE